MHKIWKKFDETEFNNIKYDLWDYVSIDDGMICDGINNGIYNINAFQSNSEFDYNSTFEILKSRTDIMILSNYTPSDSFKIKPFEDAPTFGSNVYRIYYIDNFNCEQ